MLEELPFAELIQRLRKGDETAATVLLHLYEPEIRRIARVRLRGGPHHLFDSTDISQSVCADFWKWVTSGGCDCIHTPEQLMQTLALMVCNKVIDKWRQTRARRRSDPDHPLQGAKGLDKAADPAPAVVRVLALRELLQLTTAQLSDAEWYLAEQRSLGRTWPELARELGSRPDTLRLQLSRAAGRVSRALNMGEASDV